jgi:pimeloyl-ACP methyl ester carboxylesterase
MVRPVRIRAMARVGAGGVARCAMGAALAIAIPGTAYAQRGGADSVWTTEWIPVSGGHLKARVYRSLDATPAPILVIVLHGDAPVNKPGYQYTFAQAAAGLGDVVIAAILRPGYIDAAGDTSSGDRGLTTGDNYTRDRIDAIMAVIRHLRAEYHARAVVLAGHSGGAAISADILGLHPDLAKAALLVSCPCDVPAWRAHMKSIHPAPVWDVPVESLSPQDLAEKVSSSVHVQMVVGAADSVAPPELTTRYADALRRKGIDVNVTLLPGEGHEIFLEPAVQGVLADLLHSIR